MRSAFRKISRVGSLTGGTKWYLSEDCLLAAKRMMYAVEYRRFYLRDLEHILLWPSPTWRYRLIIPAGLLAALGAALWQWVNSTAGVIFCGLALLWAMLELALGPTARSRISTTGASVNLALVKRTRRAGKVLAKIDAAVRATRLAPEQSTDPAIVAQPAEPPVRTGSEGSTTASIAAPTETNAL